MVYHYPSHSHHVIRGLSVSQMLQKASLLAVLLQQCARHNLFRSKSPMSLYVREKPVHFQTHVFVLVFCDLIFLLVTKNMYICVYLYEKHIFT